MVRRLRRISLALVVVSLLSLITYSASPNYSGSASNSNGASNSVTVTPPTPSSAVATMVNDNRMAIAYLANANIPNAPKVTLKAVESDCTLLVRAYRHGELFATSVNQQLKSAGKALFASVYDLVAYGCSFPIPSLRLHPTNAVLTRDVNRGSSAMRTILMVLGYI